MANRSTGRHAPGWPGMEPRWTSAKKVGVGTAHNATSRVWFTLSHGIFDEIYYPRVDRACTRDMGLLVANGHDFFSDEKRDTDNQVEYLHDGVPAYRLLNRCTQGRYQVEKKIIANPRCDAVMQATHFKPLQGGLEDYHVYVLLAPHLGNRGWGNTAWLSDFKGVPMLFAERAGYALALACSVPWVKRSVGFVGASDGWQDVSQHFGMAWEYQYAENGNVAMIGEVDLAASNGEFLVALGFGSDAAEAGHRARLCLLDDAEDVTRKYVNGWQQWQQSLLQLSADQATKRDLCKTSAMVLYTHEAKSFQGGVIASLSIPWGFAKSDNDLGGYHLVWVRDLVEAVGGLLAVGAHDLAKRVLRYLQTTQKAEGDWPQNMWLAGVPYWTGTQMDETGFPILMTASAHQQGSVSEKELLQFWPMVRRAAGFIVRNGPVTQQDRWEENAGYSPFTLAVEVAALLASADLADLAHEKAVAAYLRETANIWNASIESWTYATDTDLARRVGVEGYYVRITPPNGPDAASPARGSIAIKNRPADQSTYHVSDIVSPDALALVRFGLRAPDDPRIVNTIKVIDALLKVDTPSGPAWHRYNEDGYGEHADGAPFDGTGIGRAWPLLTGERAHYELAAGRRGEAERLLHTLEAFANEGGMIPEQIWDSADIPNKELCFGRPSGSGTPLVWAHAEYIKLRRSLRDGKVFDMPPQTVERYLRDKTDTPYAVWRFDHRRTTMPAGRRLRIETLAPARVHWSSDGWQSSQDIDTRDTELGIHVADLPTQALEKGTEVGFTFYWPDADRWEGQNFVVAIGGDRTRVERWREESSEE
ncbi:MAG: glucan 1,4-alpha-glucosidase [Anaerolineae bacterium]